MSNEHEYVRAFRLLGFSLLQAIRLSEIKIEYDKRLQIEQ